MDWHRLNNDLRDLQRRNRGLGLGIGLLALGQCLALVAILNLLGSVRTVVVPPAVNKSFWVDRDRASSEYLERGSAGSTQASRQTRGADSAPARPCWNRPGIPQYHPQSAYHLHVRRRYCTYAGFKRPLSEQVGTTRGGPRIVTQMRPATRPARPLPACSAH